MDEGSTSAIPNDFIMSMNSQSDLMNEASKITGRGGA